MIKIDHSPVLTIKADQNEKKEALPKIILDFLGDTTDNSQQIINNKEPSYISPLDYYQVENGMLIEKLSIYKSVNEYRDFIYNSLADVYSEEWIDNLFTILNSTVNTIKLYEFTSQIKNKKIKGAVYILSILELELTGKRSISSLLIDKLDIEGIDNKSKKAIGMVLFERGYYPESYNLLKELINDVEVTKDISLMTCIIILNKIVNGEKGNKELLDTYHTSFLNNEKGNTLDKEEYDQGIAFYYENYLDYYMMNEDNPDELINKSYEYINTGLDNEAITHLVYGYLLKGKKDIASDIFNQSIISFKEMDFKNNPSDLELFYIYGTDLELLGALQILINFYREEFKTNGHNEDYYENLVIIANKYSYIFKDEDRVFFQDHETYIEELKKDEDENIAIIIEFYFDLYELTNINYYLNEIFLIISKQLNNKYKNTQTIKKSITLSIEKLVIIFNSDASLTEETLVKKLGEKEKELENPKQLEIDFKKLILSFAMTILDNIEILKEGENKYNIPLYIANIFRYYNLSYSEDLALSYDDTFFNNY